VASRVSFKTDIRPLFRDRDLSCMAFAFDLASYDEVTDNADAILRRLRSGTMPMDGAWPQERIDLFARWVETGKQR
jgi:hypothetical protein